MAPFYLETVGISSKAATRNARKAPFLRSGPRGFRKGLRATFPCNKAPLTPASFPALFGTFPCKTPKRNFFVPEKEGALLPRRHRLGGPPFLPVISSRPRKPSPAPGGGGMGKTPRWTPRAVRAVSLLPFLSTRGTKPPKSGVSRAENRGKTARVPLVKRRDRVRVVGPGDHSRMALMASISWTVLPPKSLRISRRKPL